MLDLVNEKDEVIGTMERNEVYAKGLSNFRVINVFLKNSDGKLFIPRRQLTKRLFPGGLDVSCGGHVSSGETYLEACTKEVSEELNFDLSEVSCKVLGTMNPHNDGVSAFMTVYEIETDETPDYNREDFSEHYWLSPQEVIDKIANGDIAKGDLPKLLQKLYLTL